MHPYMSRPHNVLLIISVVLAVSAVLFSAFFFRVNEADDASFAKEYGLTLTDYEGKEVHLFDYRRKVLVAYAWASWCPYCGGEIENLAKLKMTYGNDIQIVAINRAEPPAVARAFTDRLQGIKDVVLLIDPNDSFFKEIGGYAMPETVFIDVGGTISFHQRGPIQIQEVDTKIKELLK
jgi:cytochrome c biogenesis protein CcmG, thiol:disulfide interchange protein DsbE